MPARGYTTADPVVPDRLGLAAPSGRYAVVLSQPCGITEYQNVVFWGAPFETQQVWLVVSPVDDNGVPVPYTTDDAGVLVDQTCGGYVVAKMDALPCFGAAFCDVSYELAGGQ
jgi:hypothetical protein